MSKYWSELLSRLTPYEAGEQPQDQTYIKLNTNENPYPPSPKALERIKVLASAELRLYPDPEARELKAAIAEYYKVTAENIFVGNGSDEVLAHTFQAFFIGDRPLFYPDITYSFYPVYCDLYGITPQTVALTEGFEIDLDAYPTDKGGIIFPNPNAPTGRYLETDNIEALLKRNSETVVVVDEAYIDFGGESCIPLIKKYPNLLVVQTFSKSRSLAGLRVGFAIGDAELIRGLDTVKDSFNSYPLDRLAIGAAIEAVKDKAHFEECCKKVIETREWTEEKLKKLGFDIIPSRANFLMVQHKGEEAKRLYKELKKAGVLVRYFAKPKINNCLRITIGTDEEMKTFIDRLKVILK